jgi:hypothetical protein
MKAADRRCVLILVAKIEQAKGTLLCLTQSRRGRAMFDQNGFVSGRSRAQGMFRSGAQ